MTSEIMERNCCAAKVIQQFDRETLIGKRNYAIFVVPHDSPGASHPESRNTQLGLILKLKE